MSPVKKLASGDVVVVGNRHVPIVFIRNPHARRYVLRLRNDGSARVTIPRGGSVAEAERFARRNNAWIERQLVKLAARPMRSRQWTVGTEILLRGETVRIELDTTGPRIAVRLGSETFKLTDAPPDLRPMIEKQLWRLASKELPPKVMEFAALNELTVRRVTVRNQRSRWGSCSRRGTISLNWRLVQTPPFVRDYIILHELMHLRQMNHSAKFWREVERVCPGYEQAEQWLKKHSDLLR